MKFNEALYSSMQLNEAQYSPMKLNTAQCAQKSQNQLSKLVSYEFLHIEGQHVKKSPKTSFRNWFLMNAHMLNTAQYNSLQLNTAQYSSTQLNAI